MQPLLDVKDLTTSFFTEHGELRVVDRVSFFDCAWPADGLGGRVGFGQDGHRAFDNAPAA